MTEPLTPAQAAAEVTKGIGDFGFTWMADKAGRERGKAELGLRGRALYHLGRAGVLGDVPVEVVVAAEAFYPPDGTSTSLTPPRVARRRWPGSTRPSRTRKRAYTRTPLPHISATDTSALR